MKRILLSTLALGPAMLLAALLVPATVAAAGPLTTAASCSGTGTVTCDLYAEAGSLSLPGTSVPAWGFATSSGGSPVFPGPTIVVTQGDVVTVNLTNNLSVATSLVFGGVAMVPDLTPVAGGGASHAYTFTAADPGTYLYQAGLLPGTEYQVSMGLYGVIVVRPAGAPGQAYHDAPTDASTAFDDEAQVVVSEIDLALNTATSPGAFDLRNFAPRYFLVNGRAYTTAAPTIEVTSGNTLLLRYLNAGILHRSMGVLGLHQRVLAVDGSRLPYPRTMVAETIAPGQTADVLIDLPATDADHTLYPVYDASLVLNNSAANGIGGMLAFIDATGTAGGDTVGPVTSGVTLAETGPGSGLYTLTASVSDASTGNADVAAAEFRIDSPAGAPSAMSASDSLFDSPTEDVTSLAGEIDASGLGHGTHAIYVRGQDALGNWGAMSSTSLVIDEVGPTVSGLVLNPDPSSGSTAVTITGTASDVGSGGSNVTAAEYFVGAEITGHPLTLNKTATIVSLSGSINPPIGDTIHVHAKDAAGNWGLFADITPTIDTDGPTASSVVANPTANNGSYGQSSSNPSVRVKATLSDSASNIGGGEGFIGTVGDPGTGFPFAAIDGALNEPTEDVYADIPLTTINLLAAGEHPISVRGRDAVGNWGATAPPMMYLIDRTAPTFTGISLSPNPTNGATTITLTVISAADPLVGGLAAGVAGGEYWIDAATPAPGGGTRFTGTTPAISTASLSTGNHTIGSRIRDAAGNWSATTASATVLVVPDAIFSNGFETGNRPWGWTLASTNSATRLNVTTGPPPPLVDTRSLQAQGNNTNYVQHTFGTAAAPATATYDAQFTFRPNGNTSTGKSILVVATAGNAFGSPLFHVRYRLNGGTPEVQLQVGATANATWTPVLGGTSNNVIEVVWQSGATLDLYVNGAPSQTLPAGTGSVGAVRLGSATATGNATHMYFDAFASKRTTSPLFGP